MKPLKLPACIICMLMIFSCEPDFEIEPAFYSCSFTFVDSSENHRHKQRYQKLLDEITYSGAPGIMMSVYNPEAGMWLGASGKADLSNNINMKPCNLTRMGSTVKTFTAAAILLLKEEGKLQLDDPITTYLSHHVLQSIENANRATVRQLLQHSSGIYNYIQSLQFQTASLNDLIKEWKPEELLQYARNRKAYFSPGADVKYSNTNYILLGMIIEAVEKKPFYEVFEEKLFIPHGLTSTRFAATAPVPDGIVRGYVDFYSKFNVIDATYYSGWDYYTADGGLISNPYDLNIFMTKLMLGEIISKESLAEMTACQTPSQQDPEFYKIHYGLGIFKMETPFGPAFFHSGDAVGYYANMVFFPDQNTTVAWAANGNYGKIDEFTSTKTAMDKIFQEILR